MKGWTTSTIGELCDAGGGSVQTGPFRSQLHESDYSETGTPVVMPKDNLPNGIDETGIARISEGHVYRLRRHTLTVGDIVFGRRGDIGRQALIRPQNAGWICGTGCLRISLGGTPVVIPEFVHGYLKLSGVIRWIEAQAIGATMPNLNSSILRRVPVTFPVERKTQSKIAAIVCSFDELIHVLACQTENLVKTRDLLLPRLISGRLAVEDLDIQFPPGMVEERT